MWGVYVYTCIWEKQHSEELRYYYKFLHGRKYFPHREIVEAGVVKSLEERG